MDYGLWVMGQTIPRVIEGHHYIPIDNIDHEKGGFESEPFAVCTRRRYGDQTSPKRLAPKRASAYALTQCSSGVEPTRGETRYVPKW